MTLSSSSIKAKFSKWVQERLSDTQNKTVNNDDSILSNASIFKEFVKYEFRSIDINSSMSIFEILDEIYAEGKNNENNSAADLMRNLLQNDEFNSIVDLDGDGKVSKDETSEFLNKISDFDGNKSDVSVKDILSAVETIISEADKVSGKTNKKDFNIFSNIGNGFNSSPIGNQYYGTGTTGNYGSYNGGSSSNAVRTQSGKYDNMSYEQLQAAKGTAQNNCNNSKGDVNNAQQDITNAKNDYEGAANEQNEIVKNNITALNERQEAVETIEAENKEEIQNAFTAVTDQQSQVDTIQGEVRELTSEVTTKSGEVNTAVNNVNAKSQSLAAAQAALAAQPRTVTDAEGNTVANDLSAYEAAVAAAQAEFDAAQNELNQKQSELKNAQNNLTNKENELQTAITDLNTKQNEYNTIYENANTETQEALKQVTEALQNVTDSETERESVLSDKRQDITAAAKTLEEASKIFNSNQTELNKINNEISLRKQGIGKITINGKTIEYDAAKQDKLAKQAEYVANNVWNTVNNCTNGVEDTYKREGIYGLPLTYADQTLSFFQNDNRFTVVQLQPGQVNSLPAGTTVVYSRTCDQVASWAGHIAIELDNGLEASDHVGQRINPSYGSMYAVFLNA